MLISANTKIFYPQPIFQPFLQTFSTLKVMIDYKSGWDNAQP